MAKSKENKSSVHERKRMTTAKPDHALLSEAEKEALKIKAKQRVEELRKEEAEEDFLQKEIRAQRRAQGIDSDDLKLDDVQIFIDLPEYAPDVCLNGVKYFANFSYTVPHHVYDSLVDIMARAWEHQSEIEGKPRKHYNKKRGVVFSGKSNAQVAGDRAFA